MQLIKCLMEIEAVVVDEIWTFVTGYHDYL